MKQPKKLTRRDKVGDTPPPKKKRRKGKGPGSKSIWSYGASDNTRIWKQQVDRREREEAKKHKEITVSQGCTCPRLCDVHPLST